MLHYLFYTSTERKKAVEELPLAIPGEEKSESMLTRDERIEAGRALRKDIPRSAHAEWRSASNRPDPIDLLLQGDQYRLAELVPIRYGRMLVNPFTFLRGSAMIMANDLAGTATTGIRVQVCGDAHLSNFGTYATPERNRVFDVNDFDETLPGPWEWDIKRLATSFVVAGRSLSFPESVNRQAALRCVQSYREHMWMFAGMSNLDLWYTRIDIESTLLRIHPDSRAYLHRELERARRRTNNHVFPKLAREDQGKYAIKDDPPLISHIEDGVWIDQVPDMIERYIESLPDDRRVLLSRYRLIDIALKVVGVGSVGTRCYIALLLGDQEDDPLFLQIKQAEASVLEPYVGISRYGNHARRIVYGQRLMQAASDIFLGWTRYDNINFYVRQLRDMSLSPNIDRMGTNDLITYAGLCGWVLARGHARSGDSARISSYLGKSDTFDQAITAFAETYADQVERDHAALVAAVESGRITAEVGV
jgi:uncharacterized protein (DUF2252 family)